MMVLEVLEMARTLLNDDAVMLWQDPKLLPKFRAAHLEMEQRLAMAGVSHTKDTSADMTVNAGDRFLNLHVDFPRDYIIHPISLKEKGVGETDSAFVDMIQSAPLPNVEQGPTLTYWTWEREQIILLGSTVDRVIRMYYNSRIVTPTKVSDELAIPFSELYLSYKVASLALSSVNDSSFQRHESQAQMYLERMVSTDVKQSQNLPTRRRGYHRGRVFISRYII